MQTTPDGIRYPGLSDTTGIVPALATLAEDVQGAIARRANYFVGTTAELAGYAATAPEGSMGYDSTLGEEVRLVGGEWVQYTAPPGPLPTQVQFTSNGTFVKADYPGARAVRVRLVGGGGAGGAAGAPPAGSFSCGAGGGGGGYAEALIPIENVPASVTVTVGAGGTGTSGTGNAGGTSSFGSLVSATGGEGGLSKPGNVYSPYVQAGSGGVGTAGDLLISGQAGSVGAGQNTLGSGGSGGGSMLGGGGRGAASGASNASIRGFTGGNYGGGGGGSYASAGGVGQLGGNGAPGIVIVDIVY